MTLIDAGEVQLDYERCGDGEPLLLIMGMSGTALHWGEPFLDELRRDFDAIAYDHRGVGASSPLDGAVTIRQMADDAAALLRALGLDSAHVIGISMGGMIAQELALNHRELIRTLTLGCTYCGGPGSALSPESTLLKLQAGMASGDREQAIRAGWEVNVSPAFAADDDAYARFRQIGMTRAVAVPVIMRQIQACTTHDAYERLPQLAELPTLVLHGAVDALLPAPNGELSHSRIAGSRLEIFDDVGHLFFWELPERSAELVREHAAVPA